VDIRLFLSNEKVDRALATMTPTIATRLLGLHRLHHFAEILHADVGITALDMGDDGGV
jgi:hypothetical protein